MKLFVQIVLQGIKLGNQVVVIIWCGNGSTLSELHRTKACSAVWSDYRHWVSRGVGSLRADTVYQNQAKKCRLILD